MTEAQRRRFTFEHPAYRGLTRAIDQLTQAKNVKDVPGAAVVFLENAGALMRGSIDVLLEHDPLKYELGIIAVLLRESLSRNLQKVDGELKETYEIKDEYLLGLAASKAHALPSRFG